MLELSRTVLMDKQDLQDTDFHSLTPHFHTLLIKFQLLWQNKPRDRHFQINPKGVIGFARLA
ncbi:MAG: hypothetical protein KJO30_12610, partial [Boseongicola sp.]|nr:hypothetical protein [Boseongicola sp.]